MLVVLLVMAPPSQELEPPINPARFRVHNTARFVAEKLASFGINHIETGIAETGVVAMIQGSGGDGPTIGLRADMDALPIAEASNKPWASDAPGRMHACGHDGHTAMLLGAAKHLVATRNFKETVVLILQPAEEAGRGAERMVQEGIMDRFGISQVFGMHNMPGMDVGKFGICDGSIIAALDEFDIIAAMPHLTIDPVVVGAQIIVALQTLVSRNTDPTDALVISVTRLSASEAYDIIPDHVELGGTVRSLSPVLRDFAELQIKAAPKVSRAASARRSSSNTAGSNPLPSTIQKGPIKRSRRPANLWAMALLTTRSNP